MLGVCKLMCRGVLRRVVGGRKGERKREKTTHVDYKLTFEPVSEDATDAGQSDEKDVEQLRHRDLARKREKARKCEPE